MADWKEPRMKPEENSIGAIHNWHENNLWEHYKIVEGKAKRISEHHFHELMDQKFIINQPLYVED